MLYNHNYTNGTPHLGHSIHSLLNWSHALTAAHQQYGWLVRNHAQAPEDEHTSQEGGREVARVRCREARQPGKQK